MRGWPERWVWHSLTHVRARARTNMDVKRGSRYTLRSRTCKTLQEAERRKAQEAKEKAEMLAALEAMRLQEQEEADDLARLSALAQANEEEEERSELISHCHPYKQTNTSPTHY